MEMRAFVHVWGNPVRRGQDNLCDQICLLCVFGFGMPKPTDCAAMHSSKDRQFSCPCLFGCESGVESPVQFLSAYFLLQSCIHFTNAVSANEGSIELVHILAKAGRQRLVQVNIRFCQNVGSDFSPMGSRVWIVNCRRSGSMFHIRGAAFALCLLLWIVYRGTSAFNLFTSCLL